MSDHEWCRDTARDEAIRAAEDAAAVPSIQHRDLPEVVAALTERVARLEAAQATLGSGDVYADVGCGSTAEEITRLTSERDAARAEEERLKAQIVALEGHSRMDIEREIAVEEAWERCGIVPHWPDDEPGTSQRYAASMETEIGRLRAIVAELERAYSSECDARAQAHRELSELNDAIRDRESGEERDNSYGAQCREAAAARDRADRMNLAPAGDPASPADGMRTERVTLEFRIEGSPPTQWPWSYILRRSDAIKMRPGESVRVVEQTEAMRVMTKLRRERDAARAECERLRTENALLWQAIGLATTAAPHLEIKADDPVGMMQCVVSRVAELEAAKAANAGGGNQLIGLSPAERDGLQVIADGVRRYAHGFIVTASSDEARAVDSVLARHSLAAPPEPRGWLTAEERSWLENEASRIREHLHAVAKMDTVGSAIDPQQMRRDVALLESLLARESPPRVKVPSILHRDLPDAVADLRERVARLEAAKAAPPPPRGWLTAEEREAVEQCRRHFVQQQIDFLKPNDPGHRWLGGLEVWRRAEAALASLLARSSPPMVKVPPAARGETPLVRDLMWGQAIREAGGEVE